MCSVECFAYHGERDERRGTVASVTVVVAKPASPCGSFGPVKTVNKALSLYLDLGLGEGYIERDKNRSGQYYSRPKTSFPCWGNTAMTTAIIIVQYRQAGE